MLHAEHVDGHAALELELRPETLEEIVEAIGPARTASPARRPPGPVRPGHRCGPSHDAGRADPRQVVEPDVLDLHVVGIDAEIVAEPSLGPDGDVAQAHGPVALVEQRLRHDPHRVGEVDQPRARVGPCRHLLRQTQDDRHRAQRLGEPTGADRLLAQAPVADREGLVDVAGRLAADAQLHDDEVGALQCGVRVGRRREGPTPSARPQDALGETTDDVAPHVARVEQDEVVDDHPVLQVAQPVDELGGVGAPSSDDGHLCPHAAQRNIRACPTSRLPSPPCSRSTAAARRPTSSSCRGDGAVLGRARVGPSNHQLVGLEGMLAGSGARPWPQ